MREIRGGRSQAAYEFLMTYGWMFLIVLVTAAVAFSFVDFSLLYPDEVEFKNLLEAEYEASGAYSEMSLYSSFQSKVHIYFRHQGRYVVNITPSESMIIDDGGKKCESVLVENIDGDLYSNYSNSSVTFKPSELGRIVFDCNLNGSSDSVGELFEGDVIMGRIEVPLKEHETDIEMLSKGTLKIRVDHTDSKDRIDINGVCGLSEPDCLRGIFDDFVDNATHFLWSCRGLNSGFDAMCSELKPPPVNGVCGTIVNGCVRGNLDDSPDNFTHHLWSCDGLHGGSDTDCNKLIYNLFVSLWDTTQTLPGSSSYNQIKLPLESSGNYSFAVSWGDGTYDTITEWNHSDVIRTYATAGEYEIIIKGKIEGFRFGDGGDKNKISDISNWGSLILGNNGGYFWGCNELDVSATDVLNLSGVTDMSHMFHSATQFEGNLSNWDVSRVTDMSHMLAYANSFNDDLSNWDVSRVEDMKWMFYDVNNFSSNLSSWNVGRVTDMGNMFSHSYLFNNNLSNWDVSSVTDMKGMFFDASSFNGDLSGWNMSRVRDTSGMFLYAYDFNGDLSNWDVSNVLNMNNMFQGASSFNSDLSLWNVHKATSMKNIFQGASSFNSDLSLWNVSRVTNMNDMFQGASLFNSNLSGWDVGNVKYMNNMFDSATSFNQDLSGWNVNIIVNCQDFSNGATLFTSSNKPNFPITC